MVCGVGDGGVCGVERRAEAESSAATLDCEAADGFLSSTLFSSVASLCHALNVPLEGSLYAATLYVANVDISGDFPERDYGYIHCQIMFLSQFVFDLSFQMRDHPIDGTGYHTSRRHRRQPRNTSACSEPFHPPRSSNPSDWTTSTSVSSSPTSSV